MPNQEKKQRRRSSSREEKVSRKSNAGFDSSLKERRVTTSILKPADAANIHEAVKKILWDIGIVIEHEKIRKSMIIDYKCQDAENGYIKIPPELVEQALSSIPKKIQLYDLNGNLKVDTSSKTKSYWRTWGDAKVFVDRTIKGSS